MSPARPPGDGGTGGRRGRWQPPARSADTPPAPGKSLAPAKPAVPPKSVSSDKAPAPEQPGLPRRSASGRAHATPGPRAARTPTAAPRDSASGPSRARPRIPPAAPARAAQPSPGRKGFAPRAAAAPRIVSGGERLLFWVLLASVLAMGIFLVRYRERVTAHFDARGAMVPLAAAATSAPMAPLHLELADDITGAINNLPLAFPMPADPNTRAQVVLEKLLADYTQPGSSHYLPPGPPGAEAINSVYLEPLPDHRGTLAVVDMTGSFVRRHPSGIEPETLTLLSMIATLHANLPGITEVHFLVDGEPKQTLAGHADLTETYLAGPLLPGQAFQSSR